MHRYFENWRSVKARFWAYSLCKNLFFCGCLLCTAKTQYRKFKINITRKGIARPQPRFPHSCVCERFIYSQDLSAYSAAGKYVDRSWEYINRSQTHECGNWDWGRAIPFLVIFILNFRYCVFAVQFLFWEYIKRIFVAVWNFTAFRKDSLDASL